MSTRHARFKEADLVRCYRAAAKAGVRVARVEIDATGKIVILHEGSASDPDGPNEWDEVFREAS